MKDVEAEVRGARELKIKSAFLYKFTKFIAWPEGTSDRVSRPLTICQLGEDPFNGSLEKIAELEYASPHTIRVLQGVTTSDMRACHLAYLDSRSKISVTDFIEAARGLNMVTVSDQPGFINQGGIIELFVESNNVFFNINLKHAQEENIKISSRLLTLAKSVIVK